MGKGVDPEVARGYTLGSIRVYPLLGCMRLRG